MLVTVGCESKDTPQDIKKTDSSNDEDIKVFIDKETGCEYLYRNKTHGYAGTGGMTVRLDGNKQPKGCKNLNQ